jgi:hypothetical protein
MDFSKRAVVAWQRLYTCMPVLEVSEMFDLHNFFFFWSLLFGDQHLSAMACNIFMNIQSTGIV